MSQSQIIDKPRSKPRVYETIVHCGIRLGQIVDSPRYKHPEFWPDRYRYNRRAKKHINARIDYWMRCLETP